MPVATFRSPGIRFQERSTRASAPDASGLLHMLVVDSVGISKGALHFSEKLHGRCAFGARGGLSLTASG
jgi:hypothetical protein